MKVLFVACMCAYFVLFLKSLKCQYKEEKYLLLGVECSKAFVVILESSATGIPVTGSKCDDSLTG